MRSRKVSIRPTTDDDVVYLSEHLRAADVAEMQAVHGRWAPRGSLIRSSVNHTPDCRTAVLADGTPAAIYGIAPVAGTLTGVPWLLATQESQRYGKELVYFGKELLAEGLALHEELFNFVDARHTDALRWLAHIGFNVAPAKPYGAAGLPFHLFHASRGGTHGDETQL